MTNVVFRAFDDIQRLVIEAYVDGEFAHLAPADVAGCGDGLLRFLLTELSKEEGCASLEEAIGRLDTAVRELTSLRADLEASL